jgi:Flp pilus assembly protein TadG
MMKRVLSPGDSRGSAAIEFAIAAPVMISLIWGIFQVAMVLEANAGVQQALGQGARYATVYDPTTGGPQTSSAVLTKITSSKFGANRGTFYTACPETCIDTTHAASANGGYWDIQVTYSVPTNFLFSTGPTVTIVKTKRVYLPS